MSKFKFYMPFYSEYGYMNASFFKANEPNAKYQPKRSQKIKNKRKRSKKR